MSTEGNMSPYQMFYEGLSAIQNSDYRSQSNSGAANIVDAPDRVEIPNSFSPCEHLSSQLHISVQPLRVCNDFGKSFHLNYRQPLIYNLVVPIAVSYGYD